jgi:MYXO-CTERM domain-containing protein
VATFNTIEAALEKIGIKWIRDFMLSAFDFITKKVKEYVIDYIAKFLDQIRQQILALAPQVIQDAIRQIADVRQRVSEILRQTVDEAKRAAIGLDLTPADRMIGFPTQSVWAMNAFNSVAGVLANRAVVFPHSTVTGGNSFGWNGDGPWSFDASFQVEYNQLAVCEDLREIFYPCGTSVSEMLEPNYRTCQKLPEAARLNPPTECHAGDVSVLASAADSDVNACWRRTIPEMLERRTRREGMGSYTGAYPPSFMPPRSMRDEVSSWAYAPECVNPFGNVTNASGSGELERRAGGLGGGGGGGFFGSEGCAAAPSGGSGPAGVVVGLFALALVLRRRRR